VNTIQQLLLAGPPLLLAITVHEYMHGYVAWRSGDPTAKMAGRLTLNPISHIDIFGTVILPLLLILSNAGFLIAWAKPVPINPLYFRNVRRDTLLVSAAGPASNLAMALAFGYLYIALHAAGVIQALGPLELMLRFAVIVNIVLAIFNLIPIPPLDGSRIVASIFNFHHKIFHYDRYGLFLFIGLLLLFRLIQATFGFHPLSLMLYYVGRVMFGNGLYIIFGLD
jgi:Zn-dependent protease